MKSIFELSYSEGKKIDAEVRKTSYFKQYLIIYIVCYITLIIGFLILTGICTATEFSQLYAIGLTILISAFAIITILFQFKRMNLINQYYYENKVK